MTDLVNPNSDSLRSTDFSCLMNPNVDKKERYIGIVSNMLEFPAKFIFSDNQVRSASHFYDKNPRKLEGKQRLETTAGRESHMFISYDMSYLPVRCPTNEDMESYTKVPLTPGVEWKPSNIDLDGQWDDSDNGASFGANVSATSYNQSDNTPDFILSTP